MKRVLPLFLIPTVAFSGYFMGFGSDIGLSVGYSESWFSVWAGYPYSGFQVEQTWENFRFIGKLSSRVFESNLPGFGELDVETQIEKAEGGLYLGFSTEDATTVGDSEMVGAMFFGVKLKIGDDTYAFFKLSTTFLGLYRKSGRLYFGFAPVDELLMFPYSVTVGVGKATGNANLVVGYSFRSGVVAGVPTPVIDVGGLFLRFRVGK